MKKNNNENQVKSFSKQEYLSPVIQMIKIEMDSTIAAGSFVNPADTGPMEPNPNLAESSDPLAP